MIPSVAASEVGEAQARITFGELWCEEASYLVTFPNLIGKSSHRR